jgi:hypothetical protein
MNRLRWFALGVLCCAGVALLAANLVLRNAQGFSASGQPTAVETWVARWARSAALPADAGARTNPSPKTPAAHPAALAWLWRARRYPRGSARNRS